MSKPQSHSLSSADAKLSVSRLRRALVLFAIMLLVPMSLVFAKAYQQIQDETFSLYRNAADGLLARVNARFDDLIAIEERRSFNDYSFLREGTGERNSSPLTTFPQQVNIPGLVGYFQIDPRGELTSPLSPGGRNSSQEELQRAVVFERVTNRLEAAGIQFRGARAKDTAPHTERESARPATKAESQGAVRFAETLDGKVQFQQSISSLNLDNSQLDRYERSNSLSEKTAQAQARYRKQSADPEVEKRLEDAIGAVASQKGGVVERDLVVDEPELDPFQLIAKDDLTFVFQRKVWRNGSRYIQGFVVEGNRFLQDTLREIRGYVGAESDLSLVIAKADQALLEVEPANTKRSSSLLKNPYSSGYEEPADAAVAVVKGRLVAPFDSLELLAALPNGMPRSRSISVVAMLGLAILSTLAVGLAVIYRMSLTRIHLAQKKSDFVSAVSHELRTPLTSIRMYAEMLREGWVADEEKKQSYYNFIFTESERLSRLISNVLQLSRIAQSERALTLKAIPLTEALALWDQKVRSQAEHAGFVVELDAQKGAAAAKIEIEEDALVQIGINLVDNAIKFSRTDGEKRIVIGARVVGSEGVLFIRDFGRGVPPHEQRRIFELFYRAESELTRETPGTGIGLALVKDLASQMGARVDMTNQTPGAEFQLHFPLNK